ncbi:MAG: type III-B CRISPR module-associated protein Cmr5 [Thermoanaerobaculum sp.]
MVAHPGVTQSLDQKRAGFAWEKVNGVHSGVLEKYANLAKGAPSLIMGNGLMQTLAFYKSKNEKHHEELLRHVLEWLSHKESPCHSFIPESDFRKAMDALSRCESSQYIQATHEALAILKWIRQFASARK